MDKKLFAAVDEYINKLFVPEDNALLETKKSIGDNNIPQISISANQGKFLYLLALLSKARKILEIGTLGGYSTIWLARALPADGQLTSIEIDPKHAAVAQKNIERAGLSDKVEIMIGKAIDILSNMEMENSGPFDLIFIDADKPPYAEYFRQALKLSHSGTLIIADNVIRDGKVLDAANSDEMVKGVHRFNTILAATPSVTATIIQTIGEKDHDGMALAIVK